MKDHAEQRFLDSQQGHFWRGFAWAMGLEAAVILIVWGIVRLTW